MAKQTIKIEGLKELGTALGDIADTYGAKKVKPLLTRVLKKAGQPIADAGEANAPRRSGKLAASYTVTTKLSKRQRALNKQESAVEVYVGPTPHPKSVQTEFGNAHQAAEPHLRPAFDSKAEESLGMIKDLLADEITRSTKRFERQALKTAAKLG